MRHPEKETTPQSLVSLLACVVGLFLYLGVGGCTEPEGLITPTHLTSVPNVQDLQAATGVSRTGKRYVLLIWRYDTLNTNIRSWDVERLENDSATVKLEFFDLVRKPTWGFPWYADSSARLQSFEEDSIEFYYRIIPTGLNNNFVGEPSKIVHVLVRR
ncbi:MAG: hypothetical protein A3H45_06905 [Ignavibacteria bacterium RIFCSPLOWO2_02_FULL_55_14]|nr:MAG: hypothetical protein A3G43_02550 [Ignavibacteria bacterium RIFCSPLOWO2_12_FULL_56_21]OGU75180.1 MAG: hypothetical protein A3H45_06905 [Ignavibacteria bacterium RIFCSPLOWO2_02_FULL_55_14]